MNLVGKFDANTVFCISVAQRPGVLGYTLFNAAFQHAGLNMAYRPVSAADENELREVITGVRGMRVRGCGVSMPHKRTILQFVDRVDPVAQRVGAANTVVNDDGVLTAYNTDYLAAHGILETNGVGAGTGVLLLGAGGMASALACALADVGAAVTVASRSAESGAAFARRWGARYVVWNEKENVAADVLINATPIGMQPDTESVPIARDALSQFSLVIDVVAKPHETRLIREARSLSKRTVKGTEFAIEQAMHQYRLYTGVEPPVQVMRAAAQEVFG